MKKITIFSLMLYFTLAAQPCLAQPSSGGDRSLIATHGSAEVTAENDSVMVSIAVMTEGTQLNRASSENDKKTRTVLQAIKSLEIKDLKIKTSGYRVTPQKDYKAQPPVIKGYEVFNAIEVILEGWASAQLSQHVTDIIDRALDSGANTIQSVRFYIKDGRALELEASKQAVARAMERAEIMAAAAGVKLKRIVSLSTQPGQALPVPRLFQDISMKSVAVEGTTPIEIGESRIGALVEIIYEIGPIVP